MRLGKVTIILQYTEDIDVMPDQRRKTYLHQNETGMIVVEAVITLPIFLIVISVIIYLMTIFIVHNKIQYALNSAAHEVAAYSYLYEATGLRKAGQTIRNDGSTNVGNINNTAGHVMDSISKITGLADKVTDTGDLISSPQLTTDYMSQVYTQLDDLKTSANSTVNSTKQSIADIENLLSDPKGLAAGAIYIIAEEGSAWLKGLLGQAVAKGMTKKYLETSAAAEGVSVDELLMSYGVRGGYEGLDFTGSTMFCDGTQGWDPQGNKAKGDYRMIDFVVSYDIELGFAGLILPDPTLHIVQRVSVPAWTNGDGREPEDYGLTLTHH